MPKPLSQKVFEDTLEGVPDNWEKIKSQLMMTEEELLPELQAATEGVMTHHPLLVGMAQPNAHTNYLLLVRKHQIEQAEQNKDWFKFIFTHERPYQLEAFKDCASKMDDKSYWSLLADVYIESENLRQNQGAIRKLLTADRTQRETLMTDEEKVVFNALPESVTIYRGYGFTNSHGWSWTTDKEKAEWFAERFASLGGVPRVATGKVSKANIIAYFDGREEKEIVCDPKLINDIQTERLDGKQDKPRIPREDKYGLESYSQALIMHMKENSLLLLSELKSAFEFMYEEAESLIEQHGEEKLCNTVDLDSIDSVLLRSEIKATDTIGDIPGNISEAFEELKELQEEYTAETLCGDFDIK